MDDDDPSRGGRPRRRPPWWPEGEPFPPPRWRAGPPHFLRWIGCLFLGLVLAAAVFGAVIGAAFGRFGFHPFVFIPVALVLLLAIFASGGMRRVTRPMNSLVDAAQRIENGDYSSHVPVWGSRDLRSVSRAFNSMSARLKSIDDQRRDFLADVTHELRTPLTVIRGQAEAIADGLYPGDAAHLAPILDATQTLERLVEDLRTLVQTDAGNLVLNREPTDAGTLVHDVVESFQSQAESAGVTLSAAATPAEIPALEVDPSRIRQVIGNLLSNAIRHTPRGGRVSVAAASTPEQLTVWVTDTGAGIPVELQAHVFERFVKGPGSTGSGLGLAIARDIVAAHGGTLAIEPSTPGAGTTFKLTLPRNFGR